MSLMEALVQEVGDKEFGRAVTRSVVGLGYMAKESESTKRIYQHASGFLLSIEDTWFFITAGHVLSKIEQLKQAGWIVGEWHFDDSSGWSQKARRIPPPFTFQNEDTFVIESEKEHDSGAIRIKPFHRSELEANGKVALTEEQWRPDWQQDTLPDLKAFCLVGVPSECVQSLDTPDEYSVNKGMAFLEVIPLLESDIPPDKRRITPSFYGRIEEELTDEEEGISVASIQGMSGGPIFALEVSDAGTLKTTVIAIQSAWYPTSRIVIGCPIKGFPEYLLEQLHVTEDPTEDKSVDK